MKYKRILLKLSGETLGGQEGRGLDELVIDNFAARIARIAQSGVQVAVVVGGGNIFRGLQGAGKGFDRVHGDQMGMLATVINSKALAIFIRNHGVPAEVFTSTPMRPMARYYMRDEVVEYLEKGGVALLSGGTGNPFFTTDSGASLRACEIGADAILKATKVDGVYDRDPMKNPDAVRYETLSFDKAIADNLKVMDLTAFAMCKENRMPIVVFNINREGELERAAAGEKAGTLVC
ncbi:MAG: UMP kinase [Bacteroidales bacterium]|nr:UMP kinase [Bacteroidales bacterium]